MPFQAKFNKGQDEDDPSPKRTPEAVAAHIGLHEHLAEREKLIGELAYALKWLLLTLDQPQTKQQAQAMNAAEAILAKL